ncbi:MAG: hypothetical protein KUG78_04075 [Kangiellaceae bacterium]|nr:hypothetical protein [Kangiellaceae bacterium]
MEDCIQSDWKYDEGSKKHAKFHFVSSYLFSQIPAGLLDELEGDRIMDYLSENMELFNYE